MRVYWIANDYERELFVVFVDVAPHVEFKLNVFFGGFALWNTKLVNGVENLAG